MLKFMRKHSKWILAIGGSLLMISFLVLPAMEQMQQATDQVIGRIGSEKVMLNELYGARREFKTIDELGRGLLLMTFRTGDGGEEEMDLRWLLMLHEAEKLGLHASDAQVRDLLLNLLRFNSKNAEDQLNLYASRERMSRADIDQAFRHWLILQQYQELVHGLGHMPMEQRLGHLFELERLPEQYRGMRPDFMMMVASAMARSTRGQARLSRPALKHALFHQSATATIEAVLVDPEDYLTGVDPSPETLAELFDKYKDSESGEGEPDGFGYRFPDRLKVEYIVMPFDRLRKKVSGQLEEAEIYRYYDENQDTFTEYPEPPELPTTEKNGQDESDDENAQADQEITDGDNTSEPPPPPEALEPTLLPYEKVRDKIVNTLQEQKANDLGRQYMTAARNLLLAEIRAYPDDKLGYKDLPRSFNPMSLAALIDDLHKEFGLRPDMVRQDDRWLDRQDAAALADIGRSIIDPRAVRGFITFDEYVFGTQEISKGDLGKTLVLAPRLQSRIPSPTMRSMYNRNFFLFRVIDAEPARTPAKLEEVKDKVLRDARRVVGFKELKADKDTWKQHLNDPEIGMDKLAEQLGTTVINPPPFARRKFDRGTLEVPDLLQIGRDESVVDAIFDRAEQITDSGGMDQATSEQTALVLPVIRKQSLAIIHLKNYQPMTATQFNQQAVLRTLDYQILESIVESWPDPLSLESLKDRTGFQEEAASAPPLADNQQDTPAPGSITPT